MENEVSGVLSRRALCIVGYGVRVERPGLYVESCAGPDDIHHRQTNDQRERRDHFKIEQCLAADAADFFHVAGPVDA